MVHRSLTILACLAFLAAQQVRAADAVKLDPAQIEFFEKRVRPVLVTHCLKCHGQAKQKGGLRLDSPAAMRAGGDSGPAMVAGKPDASLLIKAIRYNDNVQMPPGKKLPDEQIAALTAWVKMGAPWPAPATATRPIVAGKEFRISPEDRAFWSFQPVKEPALPVVRNTAWPKTAIDRFILAKLEANSLTPVPPADKATWLRRVSFDLIGLPPTPEEVADFLRDESPDAYAKVADRLLVSPHYGERWARHWLDVARYGEDQAHSFQPRLFPNGYRYRDWIVKALNNDMPYDRFLTEQIAGDLIDGPGREERLAALGYFALGPHYYGKAIAEELDDRVDTLCRGMLGLTVACARCHDHKFDPIPTKDYYSLAGIFASTDYKEYPIADAKTAAAFERAQAVIKAKNDEITKFLRAESARWSAARTVEVSRYMVASWKLTDQRKEKPTLTVSDFAKKEKLHDFVLERWVAYLFPKTDDNRPHLANWRQAVKENNFAAIEKAAADFQEQVRAIQAKPEETAKNPLYKEVVGGLFDISYLALRKVEKLLDPAVQKKLAAERAEVEKLKKALPKIPTVHSLADSAKPANMKVYLRGNPATPGDEAPRRFLDILSGSNRPLFAQGSGRLELARAIASKDNPLTARVLVNRVWAYYFGKGIVATPSNFGRLGERPTHPELLDHLAARFMAEGWSLKKLHRDIVLSSVYQLSSRTEPSNQRIDQANKLLWRMERRRLEVEPWRDALLAVSGNLDRTMCGPSVNLSAPDNRRRTLYAAISRHNLDGLLRLFDFPDPNITADRRPVTTVPLQQLFVLNSEFMVRQAKALAARLQENKEADDAARIRRAFLIVYGRPPRDAEIELGVDFLEAAAGAKKLTAWEQYAQVLLSANEFVFVD